MIQLAISPIQDAGCSTAVAIILLSLAAIHQLRVSQHSHFRICARQEKPRDLAKFSLTSYEEVCHLSLQWREDLAVGVKSIDEQHQELFRRINSLLEACNLGKGREEVASVIAFLGEYIDQAMAGAMSPEDALNTAAESISDLLAE